MSKSIFGLFEIMDTLWTMSMSTKFFEIMDTLWTMSMDFWNYGHFMDNFWNYRHFMDNLWTINLFLHTFFGHGMDRYVRYFRVFFFSHGQCPSIFGSQKPDIYNISEHTWYSNWSSESYAAFGPTSKSIGSGYGYRRSSSGNAGLVNPNVAAQSWHW